MIIICDVDDTVAESTQLISSAMAFNIHNLMKDKVTFLFISGSTCDQIYNQIDGNLYAYKAAPYHIMGTSGNKYEIVVDNDKRTVVYEKMLNASQAADIKFLMNTLCKEKHLRPLTSVSDQIQDRGGQITLSVLGRHAPSEAKAKLDPTGQKRAEWIKWMKAYAASYKNIDLSQLEFRIGGTTSIDVTLAGADKGMGIREFLKHNKWVDPKKCIFFGDKLQEGGNDHAVKEYIPTCIEVQDPEETLEYFKMEVDGLWKLLK